MEHGRFSNFCGAWSFLKFWPNMVILIFGWSMVASQIFVEHGCFSNCGGTWSLLFFWWSMVVSQILVEHGHFLRKLLIADKQAQKSSVPPKFEAICHILVEHDHFYFLMEHGHSSNFGGTQSFFKFWWNRDNF